MRYYYLDIAKCLDPEVDRVDAIASVPADKKVKEDFGRVVVTDLSTRDGEFEKHMFPLNIVFDSIALDEWKDDYRDYHNDSEISKRLRKFTAEVLNPIILYTKRELERQIDSMLFERTMISDERNKLFLAKNTGLTALRDSYVLEFLDIPETHKEKELRKSIVANIRNFILEFGKDFTFVGDEYRVQVGNKDFYIDLLFYNRGLSCLVAIELKVTDFKPEHLGQLEFYLEALDRDVRKPNENPSLGLVLCAGKDDMVVEYALSRSLSPALVADYQLHLPNKNLLIEKLRELKELADMETDEDENN